MPELFSSDDRPTLSTAQRQDAAAVSFSRPHRPFGDAILHCHVAVAGPDLAPQAWIRTLDGDGLAHVRDGRSANAVRPEGPGQVPT